VSDHVEVLTKRDSGEDAVRWVSDGTGEYEVSDANNVGFERGTKINLKLRGDARQFCKELEIEKILKKYSQFVSYPIKLNGSLVNNLQAIWYREKREVTEDEYERFFEQVADTKIPFKFKLHYSTDVPLAIKALVYIPSTHSEKMQMGQEKIAISLYSRKVLIKDNCQELLPNYLRFVKGVVDCEDLPLNISRETYQDSSLIFKLRNVITRRVLKMLEDESKRDPKKYNMWIREFSQFLKEGLTMDQDNKDAILRLMRYKGSFTQDDISLDDYVSKMNEGQEKIYYIVS
jgi:HSP90 family molecular chaperone